MSDKVVPVTAKPERVVPAVSIGFFRALLRFMRDADASTLGKLFVVGVVLYILFPVDLVPDLAPIIGWLDDLGVAAIALAYLHRALAPYRDGTKGAAAGDAKQVGT